MNLDYDATVIGAGVVGLAIAKELCASGLSVLVLEKHSRSGEEISSRNSGVIHAGMYYPFDSLKARLCIKGNKSLYAYINNKRISFKKTGKLIIANNNYEEKQLDKIYHQGKLNGVNLQMITSDEVREIEPSIKCSNAIISPDSGIVDVPELLISLEGDIQNKGGLISYKSEFIGAKRNNNSFEIKINSGELFEIKSKYLINSSGLHSDKNSNLIYNLNPSKIQKIYYAKGHYFKYTGANPFNHLIYPIPKSGGLGIHIGMDICGQLRFGPDIEWSDSIEYSFNEGLKMKFINAIKDYWPDLDAHKLVPDYTGIRPKLNNINSTFNDFSIKSSADHEIEDLVILEGIESPGLTSSLAIAEYVKHLLLGDANTCS